MYIDFKKTASNEIEFSIMEISINKMQSLYSCLLKESFRLNKMRQEALIKDHCTNTVDKLIVENLQLRNMFEENINEALEIPNY